MIIRLTTRLVVPLKDSSIRLACRQFSTSLNVASNNKNRIYTNVRTPDELETLKLLSASSRKPLLTLWTANWCASCRIVSPALKSLIEDDGIGEAEGGVGFTEVELHSATIGDLGITYAITSVPTLLAFSRGEAQMETRLMRVDDLKNKEFMTDWIRKEATRGGEGGAGGSATGLLGKLFGQ